MKYNNKNSLLKKHPLKRPKCPHVPCFAAEKWCVESSPHWYNGSRFVHLDPPSSQWHLAILGCLLADDARCCVPPGRHGVGNGHEDKESGNRLVSCRSLDCKDAFQSDNTEKNGRHHKQNTQNKMIRVKVGDVSAGSDCRCLIALKNPSEVAVCTLC